MMAISNFSYRKLCNKSRKGEKEQPKETSIVVILMSSILLLVVSSRNRVRNTISEELND